MKTVEGVPVLVLCISSDKALYLNYILLTTSKGFTATDPNSRVDARVVAVQRGA